MNCWSIYLSDKKGCIAQFLYGHQRSRFETIKKVEYLLPRYHNPFMAVFLVEPLVVRFKEFFFHFKGHIRFLRDSLVCLPSPY